MVKKPNEFLAGLVSKKVTVRMRAGEMVRGTVAAVDEHMNISLEGAEFLSEDGAPQPAGKVHVKGENLVFLYLS